MFIKNGTTEYKWEDSTHKPNSPEQCFSPKERLRRQLGMICQKTLVAEDS